MQTKKKTRKRSQNESERFVCPHTDLYLYTCVCVCVCKHVSVCMHMCASESVCVAVALVIYLKTLLTFVCRENLCHQNTLNNSDKKIKHGAISYPCWGLIGITVYSTKLMLFLLYLCVFFSTYTYAQTFLQLANSATCLAWGILFGLTS